MKQKIKYIIIGVILSLVLANAYSLYQSYGIDVEDYGFNIFDEGSIDITVFDIEGEDYTLLNVGIYEDDVVEIPNTYLEIDYRTNKFIKFKNWIFSKLFVIYVDGIEVKLNNE